MNSMSYPCTDTSCSESCPDHRLILVSAGHHAMSSVVVLLLSILGLIHCLRSSLLFLQDVFTCKSSYDMVYGRVQEACLALPLAAAHAERLSGTAAR